MYAGRLDADSAGARRRPAPRPRAPQPPRSIDLVLDGLATRCTEGPAAGVPPLRLALEAYADEALDGHEEIMRWLLLSPIVQSMTVFELWDDDAFHALATRAVRLARETGALVDASRRARLPVGPARVRRRVRRGVGADPGGGRDRGRHRHHAAHVRAAPPRRLARRRSRGDGVINAGCERTAQARDAWWRWPATPPPSSTTAWAATRRPPTAPSAAATTATRATPARRCRSSSRRRPVPAGRRSPPPRCTGSRSARAPRARTGRSASWPARRR